MTCPASSGTIAVRLVAEWPGNAAWAPGIFDKTGYIENRKTAYFNRNFWLAKITCEEKMAEQRETYKGKEIILRTGAEASAAKTAAGIAAEELGAEDVELYIGGERIFTVRDAGGKFIASGFAFDPQPSPIDLAKKIIDYRETGE